MFQLFSFVTTLAGSLSLNTLFSISSCKRDRFCSGKNGLRRDVKASAISVNAAVDDDHLDRLGISRSAGRCPSSPRRPQIESPHLVQMRAGLRMTTRYYDVRSFHHRVPPFVEKCMRPPCQRLKEGIGSRRNPFSIPRTRPLISRCRWRSPVSMKTGIFPLGKKQPQLNLPALVLCITVDQMGLPDCAEKISGWVTGGVSAILLREEAKDGLTRAGDLYEAAVKLQEILRDRAGVWIMGRIDIAEAVNAKGVVLTNESVPLAVARRMLKQKPMLLGKIVSTPEEAQDVAAEGTSFLLLSNKASCLDTLQRAKELQRGGRVPVLPVIEAVQTSADATLQQLLGDKLDGLCISVDSVEYVADAIGCQNPEDAEEASTAIVASLGQSSASLSSDSISKEAGTKLRKPLLLTEGRERMRQREKELLSRCLELLQRISPEIEERTLLEAALKQLDELFLVVVVGLPPSLQRRFPSSAFQESTTRASRPSSMLYSESVSWTKAFCRRPTKSPSYAMRKRIRLCTSCPTVSWRGRFRRRYFRRSTSSTRQAQMSFSNGSSD